MKGRVYLALTRKAIRWWRSRYAGGRLLWVPRSPEGLRPTESTPPCQVAFKCERGLFFPPTPSTEGPGAARLRRFSDPAVGYARRNHLMYSGVARTTSPFSVVEVVYVSKGGALNPSGRRPNASRSSLSFRFSRL